jgi:hypothetical protein
VSEKWVAVVGYEGKYMVSDLGRVMSLRTGRIFKPQPIALGNYHGVRLSKDGRTVNKRVADLVMAAFVGPKDAGIEVNHKNGVHTDNSLVNLEYVTKRQQEDHAVANALHAWGERHGMAKLTADIVRLIRLSSESNVALAARYGVQDGTILAARTGKTWKHLDTEFDKTKKAYFGDRK